MRTERDEASPPLIGAPQLNYAEPPTREQRSLAALLADPSGGALGRGSGDGAGVLEIGAGHGVLSPRTSSGRGQPGWTVRCPCTGPHPTVEVEGTLRVPAGCRASPHWASRSGCREPVDAKPRPSRMGRESASARFLLSQLSDITVCGCVDTVGDAGQDRDRLVGRSAEIPPFGPKA